ncbi:MAG TPA: 4-alpha-glucanotransferase [Methylophilus sp.]
MTLAFPRSAGVLCHISSLPNSDLGQDAYQFVDFLAETGATVWQTLPINMPHADNSPYQCISAHAGNPAFISLAQLVDQGLLEQDQVQGARDIALRQAYTQFLATKKTQAFDAFCAEHQVWLEDFALFCVIRQQMHYQGWCDWPEAYKNKDANTIAAFKVQHAWELAFTKFVQFIFFAQWQALKTYANSKHVQLFGDIPIFVAYDSADVWAQPELFKLDVNKQMTVVAGVPPDYFSATGQRWGNPHYNWGVMAAQGYVWWVERMRTQSSLFDLVRIDHFRGLESAWEIPSELPTAQGGAWVLAPGDALLAAIYAQLPNIHLVAEDLGVITPEVDALRLKYALPGMKILQFAFGGDQGNPYLPENIEENSVVYTGTHDNDTTLGWYTSAETHVKAHLHQYLQNDQPDMPQALIALVMSTQSYLAIIPMQDILGLDTHCRMNTPGTVVNNWSWQFNWKQLTKAKKSQFAQAIKQSGRVCG